MFDNCSANIVHLTAPDLIVVSDTLRCLSTDFEHVRSNDDVLPRGHSGLALWNANSKDLDSAFFSYKGFLNQDYPNDFDYWHADHTYDVHTGYYYSVVSNEIADKILVGISTDGFVYKYSEVPLYSKTGNHFINTYKPAIISVGEMTWFFFPKSDIDRTQCHIFCSGINTEVLKKRIMDSLKK